MEFLYQAARFKYANIKFCNDNFVTTTKFLAIQYKLSLFLLFSCPLYIQHRLKQSQRSKVRQFVTITGTDEHTAINCLSLNDWRMDAATDNFFTDPVRYFVEPPKAAVDKKKLDQLFNKYRSEFLHTVLYNVCKHIMPVVMNLMLVMHMHNIMHIHIHVYIVHSIVTQSGKELVEYVHVLEIHVPKFTTQ